MKKSIINRITQRNDNKYDSLLGIGYTINFIDMERDFVYQYYLFGVLGLILVLPQLFVLLNAALASFKILKNKESFDYLLLLMAPSLGVAVAYASGHVFGWVSPSYIFAFSIALSIIMMNKYLHRSDKKYDKS